MRRFRACAIVLAIGGIMWGVFCWGLFGPGAFIMLAPGYVVTVGYLVRACSTPPVGWRRMIWLTSAFVQGAWLLWAMNTLLQGGWFRGGFSTVALCWWIGAFLVSGYGYVAEPEGRPARPHA